MKSNQLRSNSFLSQLVLQCIAVLSTDSTLIVKQLTDGVDLGMEEKDWV